MGDYLLLSWLCTRRGLIFFLLLVLLTAAGNLYRLASNKERASEPAVKAEAIRNTTEPIDRSIRRDGNAVPNLRYPRKTAKPAQPR
jgi:hypothetical protein